MRLVADFHLHSKFSRATSKNLDFENLYVSAQIKGVQILGTGDFSHPAWFAEIESKLEPAEAGLFKLKKEITETLQVNIPPNCRNIVRFVLVTEISNIYKKDGRTRKNHNLVFVPDLDVARKLNRRLKAIGNIESDGRPILGLDARDLLEVVLDTSPDSFLVPAHIWTPWFSMLGSKSGFDSIEECFDDLAGFIFAAETGLSSDPGMNWRVSGLDHLSLISNSDAHSPANIGREANIFDTDLSYFSLLKAMKDGDTRQFPATVEFYPEEGKYHFDGHRSCGVRFEPRETVAHKGLCPNCGKPLTIGVLYRIDELADCPEGRKSPTARPYSNLIPLAGILSEIMQTGPKTSRVLQAYRTAIETLGPELAILQDLDLDLIAKAKIPLLDEAVRRMRAKNIAVAPGFDGEYGRVQIFSAQERLKLQSQKSLFADALILDLGAAKSSRQDLYGDSLSQPLVKDLELSKGDSRQTETKEKIPARAKGCSSSDDFRENARINEEQRRVVECEAGAVLVVAGPGTGKTHTLTARIARQISGMGISADSVLAITFTNRAAEEMRSRLIGILGKTRNLPVIATFHGLCLMLLRELHAGRVFGIIDEDEQGELIAEAAVRVARSGVPITQDRHSIIAWIMRAKQNVVSPDEASRISLTETKEGALAEVYRLYQQMLESQQVFDYEELIYQVVQRLEGDAAFCRLCRERFRHVYVDEYQDLNHGQYRLIRALMPTPAAGRHLCVIGDPDQSIYGFRGSDCAYFHRFVEDYPGAVVLPLTRNYRSSDTILSASYQVISRDKSERTRVYSTIEGLKTISVIESRNEHAEAEAISRIIENMIGGSGFHSIDTGRVQEAYPSAGLGYADFAVLTRTNDQIRLIAEIFKQRGIPCQPASRRNVCRLENISQLLALYRIISATGSYADFEKIAGKVASRLGKKVVEAFREWCLRKRFSLKDGLAGAARFPIPGLVRHQQSKLNEFARCIAVIMDETAHMDAGRKLFHLSRNPHFFTWSDDEESQEALNQLANMADSGESAVAFLERLALQRDPDFYHPRAERVAVMTMHAAKGLEFATTFVAGCEDDLIPFRSPDRDVADLQEERRLFYVAMTRAKERLYFTYAKRRRIFGKTLKRERSPFIKDIEERLIKNDNWADKLKKKQADQLQLF